MQKFWDSALSIESMEDFDSHRYSDDIDVDKIRDSISSLNQPIKLFIAVKCLGY